jgi:hypothetical protein
MSITQKIIKETKYCEIHNQGRYVDEDYTYCIEKIYVKGLKRFEIRFSLYKDLKNHTEKYIARSLDVTELELVELFKDSIANNVFSSELIEMLRKVLNPAKKPRPSAMQKEKLDDTSNEMLIEEEPMEEEINSEESV